MRLTKSKLHEERRKYLLSHTPTDRIIEESLQEWSGQGYSEFVASAGGDVTVYRVYGYTPDTFKCCIH